MNGSPRLAGHGEFTGFNFMTYKEIQADCAHLKESRLPEAFDHAGFPVSSFTANGRAVSVKPGMTLRYSDGKRYRVMSNGEHRRIR
jgi:hypothetical protein